MPVFTTNPPPGISPISEAELLRQYLNKDHRYRNKQFTLPERAITGSYFDNSEDTDIYLNEDRNASRWVGFEPGKLIEGDLFADKKSCLWGFQGGYGNIDKINVIPGYGTLHTSADLTNPTNEPSVAFYMLKGSYFGEWNTTDNFMRAALGTATCGLGVIYTR